MHFAYIVYCQYAPCIEIHFVTSSRINQCVRHARNILRTASIARDLDARTRVKETRKRERAKQIEFDKWGAARGQKERALSSACNSRQGLRFLHDREVCANQFFFFILTVEFLVSLARGGGGGDRETEKQLRGSQNTYHRARDRDEDKRQKQRQKETERDR